MYESYKQWSHHINNDPHQLLKKDPTIKIKAETVKALMNSNFIDNNLYYLKPTDSPAPRLYRQPKNSNWEFLYVLLFHVVVPHYMILTNS